MSEKYYRIKNITKKPFYRISTYFSTNYKDIMTNSGANTNKLLIMYQEYRFICDCIALPSTETYGQHLAPNIRNM